MSEHDETGALRAEVAELRAEVERLWAWQAAHVCAPSWPQPGMGAPIPCTCGQTQGCQVHPYPKPTVFCATAAGCAGGNYPQVLTVPNNTGANPPTVILDAPAFTTGCAAPAPTVFFNIP